MFTFYVCLKFMWIYRFLFTFKRILESIETTCWYDTMWKSRRSLYPLTQRWLWILMNNWTATPIGQNEIHTRLWRRVELLLDNIVNVTVRWWFLNMSTYRESHRLSSIATLYQLGLDDFNRSIYRIATMRELLLSLKWFALVEISVEHMTWWACVWQEIR